MKNLVPAEIGDRIYLNGKIYEIQEIIDQYEDWESNDLSYYGIECRTTDGRYRIWKQRFDGGKLVKTDNKAKIAGKLMELLAMTRAFEDVESVTYSQDEWGNEYVTVSGPKNEYGHRKYEYTANVTWDSGIALIKDVLKQIDY